MPSPEGPEETERTADTSGSPPEGAREGAPPSRKVKKRRRRRDRPSEPSPPEEVMEPVVEVNEGGGSPAPEAPGDVVEVDVERDVIGTGLYRERRVVEEVVEVERAPRRRRRTGRRERQEAQELERLQRELEREARRHRSWVRGTLLYKTFYDMVCNRVGVIVAGFGVAMILFTVSYDWLQGRPLSIGVKHWVALVLSVAVYFVGMALEGLRVWSWECEGLEEAARRLSVGPDANPGEAEEASGPLPMVPDDAVDDLVGEDVGRD